MKINWNRITLALACTVTMIIAHGQEHRFTAKGNMIKVYEVNAVTFTTHDGSDVIISYDSNKYKTSSSHEFEHEEHESFTRDEKNDRSSGLKMINAAGKMDNTGLGLAISEESDHTEIGAVSKNAKRRYLIQVPKNVNVYYEHSTYMAKSLVIKDFSSELEASCHYNKVLIHEVSGPLSIKCVYGAIEGQLSSINNASLHSTYGLVDLGIPGSSNLDVSLKTSYGTMYTDFDIQTGSASSRDCDYCGKTLRGKINDGGNSLSIVATYQNIYLRKKA